MFHILAYMPHDQQPWKSRVDWMKALPEGGFSPRKWMYGRGGIVGVLNPALLEEEPQPGQDILVVLADEFGFTSKTPFDGLTAVRKGLSPQKANAESEKRRNPFSSSPVTSPSKRKKLSSSSREANNRGSEAVDDEYIPIDPLLAQEFAGHDMEAITRTRTLTD